MDPNRLAYIRDGLDMSRVEQHRNGIGTKRDAQKRNWTAYIRNELISDGIEERRGVQLSTAKEKIGIGRRSKAKERR